jgi:hypothetical protein
MATYRASNIVVLPGNTELFINSLVQQIVAQPTIVNDTNWFGNLSAVQTYLDSAINSGYYQQQFNGQVMLDAAYNYQTTQNDTF